MIENLDSDVTFRKGIEDFKSDYKVTEVIETN